MSTPIVVLSIHGGVLQDVFCTDARTRTILVDWDTEGQSEDEPNIVETSDSFGRASLACVAEYASSPLAGLEGEVAEALRESHFAGDGEFAARVTQCLDNRASAVTAAKTMGSTSALAVASITPAEVLRRLIAWHKGAEDDAELLEIVAAARVAVNL